MAKEIEEAGAEISAWRHETKQQREGSKKSAKRVKSHRKGAIAQRHTRSAWLHGGISWLQT